MRKRHVASSNLYETPRRRDRQLDALDLLFLVHLARLHRTPLPHHAHNPQHPNNKPKPDTRDITIQACLCQTTNTSKVRLGAFEIEIGPVAGPGLDGGYDGGGVDGVEEGGCYDC